MYICMRERFLWTHFSYFRKKWNLGLLLCERAGNNSTHDWVRPKANNSCSTSSSSFTCLGFSTATWSDECFKLRNFLFSFSVYFYLEKDFFFFALWLVIRFHIFEKCFEMGGPYIKIINHNTQCEEEIIFDECFT